MQSVNGSTRVRQQREQQRRAPRLRRIMPAIAAASAALAVTHAANAASASWSFLGSGAWGTASNWAGGNPADGASSIADFSKLNITADQTVSLDSSRTIGQLLFADATTQSNQWTLDNGGNAGNVLTLNNGASQPVITIGNGTTVGQITTISAVLAGTNGFIKNGPGALQLTG